MKSEYGYIEIDNMKSIFIKLSEKITIIENIDITKKYIHNLKLSLSKSVKELIKDDMFYNEYYINDSYSLIRLEQTGKCIFSSEITLYPKKEMDKNTLKLISNKLIKTIKNEN